MSKTLEIIENADDAKYRYCVVSPDHGELDVNSYEFRDAFRALNEDGRLTIDIKNTKYFHLHQTDANGGHVKIAVESYEQPEKHEFTVPYRCGYNVMEMVGECGLPDTDTAKNALSYPPSVKVDIEYEDGSYEVLAVQVDGEIFSPER